MTLLVGQKGAMAQSKEGAVVKKGSAINRNTCFEGCWNLSADYIYDKQNVFMP